MADLEQPAAEPEVHEPKDVEDQKVGEEKVEEADDTETKKDTASDSYLNREEYSSERFKLEIRNLPKSFGFGVKSLNVWLIGHGIADA